jgi:hypothetical protein
VEGSRGLCCLNFFERGLEIGRYATREQVSELEGQMVHRLACGIRQTRDHDTRLRKNQKRCRTGQHSPVTDEHRGTVLEIKDTPATGIARFNLLVCFEGMHCGVHFLHSFGDDQFLGRIDLEQPEQC